MSAMWNAYNSNSPIICPYSPPNKHKLIFFQPCWQYKVQLHHLGFLYSNSMEINFLFNYNKEMISAFCKWYYLLFSMRHKDIISCFLTLQGFMKKDIQQQAVLFLLRYSLLFLIRKLLFGTQFLSNHKYILGTIKSGIRLHFGKFFQLQEAVYNLSYLFSLTIASHHKYIRNMLIVWVKCHVFSLSFLKMFKNRSFLKYFAQPINISDILMF